MHNDDWARMSIPQLVDRAARTFGPDTAYVFDDGQRVSFTELAEQVERVAAGLRAIGVGPGDRVAIWMQNRPEWVYLYLATVRVGAVLVPVNTVLGVDEAAYIVGQSDAKVLVVGPDRAKRDALAEAQLVLADPRVSAETLVVVGTTSPGTGVTMHELIENGKTFSARDNTTFEASDPAADVVMALYTSGTTGFPKGALHSHKIIRNLVDAAARMRLGQDDTLVLYLPLFHVFAAAAVLSFLYTGGTIVLMESFDPARSLELMERERATVAYGVGTMFYDQLNHPSFDDWDLRTLRLCLAPGTGALIRMVDAKMGPAINGYGMTETSSITCLPNPDDDIALRADTVGLPLPGFDVRVVDEHLDPVSPGETGELVVRGHPVMLGYYNKPAETAEVLDADGWFRTGDLVAGTQGGYLTFMGRSKDMIRVGGENVDPAEIEAVLVGHPAVSLAAVVGVEHPRLGEVPVACVQLKPGVSVDPAELVAHAQQRLAKFKVPRRIELVDDFPRTGSGKIQKFRLKEELR